MFIIQNMLLSIVECLKILNGPKCVCRLDLVHELPDSGELQLPLNATPPPPPRESKPSVVGALSLDLAVPFQVLSQRCPFPRERKSVAKRSMKQSHKDQHEFPGTEDTPGLGSRELGVRGRHNLAHFL